MTSGKLTVDSLDMMLDSMKEKKQDETSENLMVDWLVRLKG